MLNKNFKLAVIGLGYVGLPLAIEFSKKRNVIGFDINDERIEELKSSYDNSCEVSDDELKKAKNINFTSNPEGLKNCNFFIITVPTPITESKEPNLEPLFSASKLVGSYLKVNDIVVYESTVYPGCTEEECVPILENTSGLKFNKDFFCGYSPERINPGDKEHRLPNIKKITSGSTPTTAKIIDDIYNEIIEAGTHSADSIQIAEAAKVIENTQRDVNIALMNELSILFNKLNIDTESVLEAAGTKWNFLPFRPGLVGGHCIGVDPYYLTSKSKSVGYNPEIILAGRKLNDGMASYVATKLIDTMKSKEINIKQSKILIMGFTFKENCPDIRNTKVIDVITELNNYSCEVDVYDPWINDDTIKEKKEFNILKVPKTEYYDAIVLAVAHEDFVKLTYEQIKNFGKKNSVIYDLKHMLKKNNSDIRL